MGDTFSVDILLVLEFIVVLLSVVIVPVETESVDMFALELTFRFPL